MSATAPHTGRRREPRAVVHTDAKPSGRQIYAIAHKLIDVAGLEWPETRGAASELLEHLTKQLEALEAKPPTAAAVAAGEDEIPF